MFAQKVAALYHWMQHLTGFREIYASNLPSQQKWTKITPYITVFCYFC